MTDARLVVDASSVEIRASGPATGNVMLVLGSVLFPVAGWNDFVIIVLEAWLGALGRLLQETSETERIHFMEGPYAVDVRRIDGSRFRLRAFEEPSREHTLVDVRALPLVDSALAAAQAVLQVCRDAGHWSRDMEQLEANLAALRNEAPRLKG